MKLLYKIALFEHSNSSATRIVVGKIEVDECEAIEIVRFRRRNSVGDKPEGVLVVGRRVIA